MSQVKVHLLPSVVLTHLQAAPYSATPNVRPVSFLEVMDEELAHKMQKETEPASRRNQTKNQSSNQVITNNRTPVSIQTNFKVGRSARGRYSANDYVYFEEHEEYEEMEPEYEQFEEPVEEEMDDDLRLALQLSEKESSQPKKTNEDEELRKILELSAQEAKQSGIMVDESLQQPSEDEDFKLAVKLQEELESEAAAQRMQERQVKQLQQHRNGGLVGYTTEFMYDKSWQDDEEEEDYDDEEEEDEEIDLSSFTQAEKLNHYAAKYGGRVPRTQFNKTHQEEEEYEESEEMLTKHDPVIAGFKNAETLERLMDTGNLSGLRISAPVFNRMREKVKTQKSHANRVRYHQTDKSTSEQVMDNKTRILLLRLMNNDVIGDLDGVVSSGKEANVYHAMSGHLDEEGNEVEPVPCAVKIYKTTLNEFKNRSEYIDGEFRFRHQTRQRNPMKKLIKMWAEKETRNLKRLNSANIPSPVPVILRDNILIMTFIGKDGFPAPRLKDIPDLQGAKLKLVYDQCIKIMRTMYHQCHLVHADMSEYNLLYQNRQVHVIDVAQSVEWDHPNAMEFLKKDCTTMSNFFRRKGLTVAMSPKQLFDFVVDINLDDKDVDKYLKKMEEIKSQNPQEEEDEEFEVNERLFQMSFIPRTLDQVPSPVKELYDNELAFHQSVTGLSPNILAQDALDEEEEEEESEDDSDVVDETWVIVENTQL